MAVIKMEKVTLISDRRNQEQILQAVQGLQNVEVRDVLSEADNNQWVNEFFSAYKEQTYDIQETEIDLLLSQITNVKKFILDNGTTKKKNIHLERREISLAELEAHFDETTLRSELDELLALESHWNNLQERQKALNEKESWLQTWQYLDIDPQKVSSPNISVILGTIDNENWESFKQESQAAMMYLEEIYGGTTTTHFSGIIPISSNSQCKNLLNRYSVTLENYPYEKLPKEELAKVKEQIKKNTADIQSAATMIGHKREKIKDLDWAEEVLLAKKAREEVKQRFVRSPYLMVLQGWLPEDGKKDFQQHFFSQVPANEVYISYEKPTEDEIATEVPIKLKNHPVARPFEMLTEMYSLPKYNEIDPTPWFTPFYLVFFGMMVADVGYGLLMMIVTTIAMKLKVFPRGTKRFMKFFQILSIPTIIWGVIYGSFFGAALPYKPLLSTTEDVISILILSVVFGFIQIMVGLGLAAKEHIKRKDYLGAVSNGFAWQGILAGILIGVVGKLLLNQQIFVTIGTVIAIISAACVVVIPMIGSKSKIASFAGGAYDLYGITGYIGDLVSYTRLMALGISGGSIAAAFNMLVGFMPPVARFTAGLFLLVVLHGLNIFLSLLGAYVHGARLQYVEFFGKFYEGGGRAFDPLKTSEKYVNIESKKK